MEIRVDQDVENFLADLDKPTAAKALRVIDLLEKFGYRLGPPHTKKIRDSLFELRVSGRQEVRIFYTFRSGAIILFYAFIKKSQKIPPDKLGQAIKKMGNLT